MHLTLHPIHRFHHEHGQTEHPGKERLRRLLHSDMFWMLTIMLIVLAASLVLSLAMRNTAMPSIPYVPLYPGW